MTTTIIDGRSETVWLPAGRQLTVTTLTGAGRVTYLNGLGLGGFSALAANTASEFGPYEDVRILRLEASNGALTYSDAAIDFPTSSEALAAAVAALPIVPASGTVGDVKIYIGAGAPVDYTDGTPPATGEAEAGIGSIYVNTTTGKLYLNGGTKAQPLWKIVTSA